MMPRLRAWLNLFILATILTFTFSSTAHAYCINHNYVLLWAELERPDQIPVYVSIGAQTSVENAGLEVAEVVRLTREVIARHNEAGLGPVLVFAGLTAADVDYGPSDAAGGLGANARFIARPFGITVDSFTCALARDVAPCSEAPLLRACAKSAATHPKARISLIPASCEPGDVPHTLIDNDLAMILLHEFGHALGLAHNQGSEAACEASGDRVHGNAVDGNEGVMRAQIGANFPALREWRRDDLDGLTALYGPAPTELLIWDDARFPAAPREAELLALLGAATGRPPALTSASSPEPAPLYLATTDAAQRVVVHAFGPLGLSAPELVDPSPAGRSWGNPGLALGERRLFVAWSAHERPDDSRVKLRWALRSRAGGAWTRAELAAAPNSRVKRLAAGYAPGVELFLLTSLVDYDAQIRLLLIDEDAELLGDHELAVPAGAFDLGPPACLVDAGRTRCLLPYSTNALAGPKLAWVELELDALGQPWLLDAAVDPTDATGKLALARAPDQPELRGAAGSQRYALDRLAGGSPAARPSPPPELDGEGWPIAIGSAAWPDDAAARWWAVARRRIACGDGTLAGAEQCDDGNAEPGDGCSATCKLEHERAGDLAPGPTSDDDTGELGFEPDAEGCACAASRGRTLGAALSMLALGLGVGLRRPRRAHRSRRAPASSSVSARRSPRGAMSRAEPRSRAQPPAELADDFQDAVGVERDRVDPPIDPELREFG